jgi:hypothetical protein
MRSAAHQPSLAVLVTFSIFGFWHLFGFFDFWHHFFVPFFFLQKTRRAGKTSHPAPSHSE